LQQSQTIIHGSHVARITTMLQYRVILRQ